MKALIFSIFLLPFFFVLTVPVFAQNGIDHDATTAAKKSIEYTLPYPGLLPDNPFYSLKMLRDRIVGYLISDPVKKAEFNLLQANKRFQAGYYLINKDHAKANLALATIAKGQDYFAQAFDSVSASRKQGYSVVEVTREMSLSSQKQLELLNSLSPIIPPGEEAYYDKIITTGEQLIDKANQEAKRK